MMDVSPTVLGKRSRDGVKRQRVYRACEQCRSKKSKCDGQTPNCSACVAVGLNCRYGPPPKRRGLEPGIHGRLERTVEVYENILGSLITSVPESEKILLGIVNNPGNEAAAWRESAVMKTVEEMGLLERTRNGNGTPVPSENDRPTIPSNSNQLLDIYFTYTHAWFPILDKFSLIRNVSDNPLVFSILALSVLQNRERLAAERYYKHAQSRLFQPGECTLEYVQTLLILALFNIAQGQFNSAWLLVGHAGRVGVDLAFFSPTASRYRRRTWMGCVVLETFLAFALKRTPQLPP